MASGGLQKIKQRMKSVENTTKITRAMELVATSKLKRAKEQLENARPFFEGLLSAMAEIAQNNREFNSVFTRASGVAPHLYIVIAGDRGLAGGYNSNVLKLAAANIQKETDQVIAIGNKAKDYMRRNGYQVVQERVAAAENLSFDDMANIANTVIGLFQSRKVGGVSIVYTDYLSTLTQEPRIKPILPVHFAQNGQAGDPAQLIAYDPDQETVFDNIVPTFVTGVLYGALVDAYAAENAARRNAMESANENAKEVIEKLDLQYNRMRQSSITQEITEITNGAEALNA